MEASVLRNAQRPQPFGARSFLGKTKQEPNPREVLGKAHDHKE